jgi:hypothetical protein
LETRIARRPALGLEEGRSIGIKLARAAAALHRGRERLMGNHRHEESGFVGNGAGIGGVW